MVISLGMWLSHPSESASESKSKAKSKSSPSLPLVMSLGLMGVRKVRIAASCNFL